MAKRTVGTSLAQQWYTGPWADTDGTHVMLRQIFGMAGQQKRNGIKLDEGMRRFGMG